VQMETTGLDGPCIKVVLTGRLDTLGVDRIETKLTAMVVPSGKNTIIDLSQVDFIASMGLRLLIGLARALTRKGGQLVLFGAQDQVREIFDSVALSDIITIRADEASALSALGL
jgi:anti-anti-sigma factor